MRDRLNLLNTDKNRKVFDKYRENCIALAKEEYNNVGWREDTKTYAWDKTPTDCPNMIPFGGYDELSFYPGQKLWVAEDFSRFVLKDEEGTFYIYNKEEVDSVRDLSLKEVQKVHKIKMEFEGRILGAEERDNLMQQDKETSKRVR